MSPQSLYYPQRLRDEAHRFAIGAHRTKRSNEMLKNPLDEIEGVGPCRKRALLHAFGSARGVSRASVDDLLKVAGVTSRRPSGFMGFSGRGEGAAFATAVAGGRWFAEDRRSGQTYGLELSHRAADSR